MAPGRTSDIAAPPHKWPPQTGHRQPSHNTTSTCCSIDGQPPACRPIRRYFGNGRCRATHLQTTTRVGSGAEASGRADASAMRTLSSCVMGFIYEYRLNSLVHSVCCYLCRDLKEYITHEMRGFCNWQEVGLFWFCNHNQNRETYVAKCQYILINSYSATDGVHNQQRVSKLKYFILIAFFNKHFIKWL